MHMVSKLPHTSLIEWLCNKVDRIDPHLICERICMVSIFRCWSGVSRQFLTTRCLTLNSGSPIIHSMNLMRMSNSTLFIFVESRHNLFCLMWLKIRTGLAFCAWNLFRIWSIQLSLSFSKHWYRTFCWITRTFAPCILCQKVFTISLKIHTDQSKPG